MKINLKRCMQGGILFALLVFIDLITKSYAAELLKDGKSIPLIPGVLEFFYIQNRGAAFGIFQDGTFVLGLISFIALVGLTIFYLIIPDGKKYFPLRLVIIFIAAGAAGNLYDRIKLQYVRDFIYFSLIDFPVFNVADIYVTCSVFILAFLILFYYKEEDLQFGFRKKRGEDGTDK